jgi:hypothetical protein
VTEAVGQHAAQPDDARPDDARPDDARPDEAQHGDVQPDALPATGVTAADAAADRLAEVDAAPLEEHVGIYEDVHRRLQEGLADLDEQ